MSMHHSIRTVEQIADDRIKRWESIPANEKQARRLPVIAISRQAGSLGKAVAERLAEELGMDIYAEDLIGTIADTTHISESVVRMLDEKAVTFLDDMMAKMIGKYGLTSDEYFDALAKTIAAIDWHGNGVILGRGSAYMVHGRGDLRVRFIAPLDVRIENIMRELGLSKDEAKHHIIDTDAERSRFVHHYYRIDYDDIRHFDLVINNGSMGVSGSVEIVKAALRSRASG